VSAAARPDDVLAGLDPAELASFYRRLALSIQKRRSDSLAAAMLLHWLDGKRGSFRFDARYVKNLTHVNEHLRDEVRPVLLTEKKARLGGRVRWAGVLPRIKGIPPHPIWDGRSAFTIHYEGQSVSIPLAVQAKAAAGLADPQELDLFMSLHTFGLRTQVLMTAARVPSSTRYDVTFAVWETRAFDHYNWDPQKHLTVPNPDHGNPFHVNSPVAPTRATVRVYHSNARRVEDGGLAAPYDAESYAWTVTDPKIVGPAVVDAARSL
jgi:hypothetical protein